MTTRVVLKHDDASFVERLSAILRADGHEVVLPDPAFADRVTSKLIEYTPLTRESGIPSDR